MALDQFMSGSSSAITGILRDPITAIEAEVFRRLATDVGQADVDTYQAVRHDLETQQAHLTALVADNAQQSAHLERTRTELETELVNLEEVRKQLKQEEVKQAYEALITKQRAEAEAQREAAEEARRRADAEAARQTAEAAAARARVAIPAARSIPSPGGAAAAVPAPEQPAPIAPTGWVCPVNGTTAFGDTWGDPRPGVSLDASNRRTKASKRGRSHARERKANRQTLGL